MDALSLFNFVFDDPEKQLHAVIDGFPAEAWDTSGAGGAYSLRETVVHLTEAYMACQASLKGAEFKWGQYRAVSDDNSALVQELFAQRETVRELAIGSPDEKALQTAVVFTSSHDYYHVGQLCRLRLEVQPDWDSLAIYAHLMH